MISLERLRDEFDAAVSGPDAADRLCVRCVELLEIDGAAISLLPQGTVWGTLGVSGELSRRVDELQFTFGEGPCVDAVRNGELVHADLSQPGESRWPAFTGAVLDLGVCSLIALPVTVDGSVAGALDLFRREPGPPGPDALAGGLIAAELAGVPVGRLMRDTVDWDLASDGTDVQKAAGWERVEVYQATGMIMGQLDVEPGAALMRLRGYAFAHGMTASDVAWSIIERRLRLDDDNGGSANMIGRPR
jgi:GAF domain